MSMLTSFEVIPIANVLDLSPRETVPKTRPSLESRSVFVNFFFDFFRVASISIRLCSGLLLPVQASKKI